MAILNSYVKLPEGNLSSVPAGRMISMICPDCILSHGLSVEKRQTLPHDFKMPLAELCNFAEATIV